MINQLPPELFAQRPVRSEYQPPKGTSAVTKRRVFLVGGIAVILLGSIFLVDNIISKQEDKVVMIPHIASTGDVKERPEQPGGIDIPHRDVAVFSQLDERVDAAEEEKVEQLLPQAEEPALEMEVQGEEVVASLEKVVTESLEAELNKSAETMIPAVTEATVADQEEALLDLPAEPPVVEAPVVETSVPEVEATVIPPVTEVEVKKAITTKAVEPVKVQVKEAVKKAERTMKVDAPKVVKKAKKVTVKVVNVPKPKEPARLPADLFTKGEAAVTKVSGKMMRTQLGSFRSSDIARKASEGLERKYSSSLNGKKLKVVRADLGAKGIYYRVMSVAMPEAQARSVCSTVKAAKAACLLVR